MLCISEANSQNLAQQDSTFHKTELKHISKLLTEVDYRRVKESDMQKQINVYSRAVSLLEYKDSLNIVIKSNLNKMIEDIKPQFWDKFYIGAIASAVLFLILRK